MHYFPRRTFEIPFVMGQFGPVRQVILHASADGKTWTHIASATPSDNRFVYTAPDDGWYYFIIQVEMGDGRLAPANVQLAPPGLRVCVDTVKPLARLRAVAPQNGCPVAVEWEVSDNNLDLRTLRLQFAQHGSDIWKALSIRQLAHAQYSWWPGGVGPFDVRVQIKDLAGNLATAMTTVMPGSAVPQGAGYHMPGPPARVIHVKNKTFKLHYKPDSESVGPSGVKHVEIWQTRNTRRWEKVKADAPPEGPFEITVPTTGRYGFTLRPVNGVGRGPKPPIPLQSPQIWVEVDEQAPAVVLHSVVVGEGPDLGSITVNWKATDPFLRDRPITIKYAKPGQAPGAPAPGSWIELQTNVENTGTCRCAVPKDIFEFYVRVEAVDKAGNVGAAETKETVKVDPKLPVIKDDDVKIETGSGMASPVPGG